MKTSYVHKTKYNVEGGDPAQKLISYSGRESYAKNS